jgi:ferredoxin
MIVYFTGTGNSRWCAEALSRRIGDDMIDAFEYIKTGHRAELRSVKPWVFAAPTYAWRLPRIFSDFLRAGSFSGSRDAYFVMTCGGDIGNAPEKNRLLCQELGLEYRGTLQVVMPENYVAMFPVPGRDEALGIIESARPALRAASARIGMGRELPSWRPGLYDIMKSGYVNSGFYKMFVKADKFLATDRCTGCGKCVKGCVLNNIRLEDGRPVWGSECTHCMACICKCPASAIEYGKKSLGKPRYVCPAYTEQA